MVRHARIRTVAIECLSTGRGAGEVCEQDDRANVRSNPLPGGAGTHAQTFESVRGTYYARTTRHPRLPSGSYAAAARGLAFAPWSAPLPPSRHPSGYADRRFAQSGTRARAPSGVGEAQRSRAIGSPTERATGWHGNAPHVVGRCRSASTARNAVAALRGAVGSSGRGTEAWPAHVHVRGRAGRRL